jgi:hypothetical protein
MRGRHFGSLLGNSFCVGMTRNGFTHSAVIFPFTSPPSLRFVPSHSNRALFVGLLHTIQYVSGRFSYRSSGHEFSCFPFVFKLTLRFSQVSSCICMALMELSQLKFIKINLLAPNTLLHFQVMELALNQIIKFCELAYSFIKHSY